MLDVNDFKGFNNLKFNNEQSLQSNSFVDEYSEY